MLSRIDSWHAHGRRAAYVDVPRERDQHVRALLVHPLADEVAVVEGHLDTRGRLRETTRKVRRRNDGADVRLDGEPEALALGFRGAQAELFDGALEGVRIVRPFDSGQDRQPGRLEADRELEHVAEERARALALGRVGVIGRHRLQIRPREHEDVADRQPDRGDVRVNRRRRAGDVAADVFRPDDRAVPGEEDVDALDPERGDELEDSSVRTEEAERVVGAGELHVRSSSSGLGVLCFVIENPPSAAITAPVTPRASSERRNATTASTACVSGSSAGTTTFAVTPCSASSTAATCATVVRNAPATPSRVAPAIGRAAAAAETKTIRPPCRLAGVVARPEEGAPHLRDHRVPVRLLELEKRRSPRLDRSADVGVAHENVPTTNPPSTLRYSPVT